MVLLKISAQDTGALKKFTNVIDSYPMFSPDGKKIVFESNRNLHYKHRWHLYETTLLMILHLTEQSWSPDGKLIVFASERDKEWKYIL